jgi:hypothetical protein
MTHVRVPTLPTPTTLRAMSTTRNCSMTARRSLQASAVLADQLLQLPVELV